MEDKNINIERVFTIAEIKRIARERFKRCYRRVFAPYLVYVLLTAMPLFVISAASMLFDDSELKLGFSPSSVQGFSLTASYIFYIKIGFIIYAALVFGALKVSAAHISLSIIREESISAASLLRGFGQYWQALGSSILESLFRSLWSLATLIPAFIILNLALSAGSFPLMAAGFVFAFIAVFFFILMTVRYTLWNYIAADDPNVRPSITIAASVSMLKGSEISLLTMMLSFAGWAFLIAAGLSVSVCIVIAGSGLVMWFLAGAIFTACIIGMTLLLIYIFISLAVFYSAVSGNFSVKREYAV